MSAKLSPLVQDAVDAFKRGDKEEAIRLLTQAIREDRQDEGAWMYLGAIVDDPVQKRQAFEQAVRINPANQQAQAQLAKLPGGAPPPNPQIIKDVDPATGSASSGTVPPPRPKIKLSGAFLKREFGLPVAIDGAPDKLSIIAMVRLAFRKLVKSAGLYLLTDPAALEASTGVAMWWNSVFLVAAGAIAIALAEVISRLIFALSFIGFLPILRLILGPILGGLIAIAGVAAGYTVALLGPQLYLESQRVKMSLVQHAQYYTQLLYPILILQAILTLFARIVIPFSAGVIILLPTIVLTIYIGYLLKGVFDKLYGAAENRGLITAAITVGGGFVANIAVVWLLTLIFRSLV